MKEMILNWARERNLLEATNSNKQFLKLIEEVGELANAMGKRNSYGIKDSIGDIQVVLIILSYQLGFDYDECLESAYNEIKNRTGKTVNGIFIKDADNG